MIIDRSAWCLCLVRPGGAWCNTGAAARELLCPRESWASTGSRTFAFWQEAKALCGEIVLVLAGIPQRDTALRQQLDLDLVPDLDEIGRDAPAAPLPPGAPLEHVVHPMRDQRIPRAARNGCSRAAWMPARSRSS